MHYAELTHTSRGINQDATVLAGIPREALIVWKTQLQQALLAVATGSKPITLSYAQADGRKEVTYNVTGMMQIRGLLDLVNRCLGYPPSRVPMVPYFR
jgi:hypothetical protein